MTLPTIDTHDFTRRGDAVDGTVPLAALERLGTMLSSVDGALAWHLAGRSEVGADGSRSAFLHLDLDGTVRMRCVRCLEPVEVPLEVARDYRLVSTEAQAEREDAEEDAYDLLVASRRFDLASLVEDEAIMALPPAPRHDDCSAPEVVDAPPDEAAAQDGGGAAEGSAERRNPFAALAALKPPAPGPALPGGAGDDASGEPPPAPARPRRR